MNDTNSTSVITSSGAGNAVSIRGTAAAVAQAADPSVTIAADVVNAAGSTGDFIHVDGIASGTGVTFNGDVTDTIGNGRGIVVQRNSAGTTAFNGTTTLDTNTFIAVTASDNTGATITFDDLNATSASTGSTFYVEGGGEVTVNDTNSNSQILSTGTGSAVTIDGDNGGGITGNSTVTINAAVANNGTGRAVLVQDRTGELVTFAGAVGDGGAVDGGVRVEDVTGGTVAFSESLTVNTSNQTGVDLLNNTGATVTFNGMDVTTNGQTGFSAVGGGTVNAVSTTNPNDVSSDGGTGVIADGMTIGGAGLDFNSVDVMNTPNGVLLTDNTGSAITIGSSGVAPGQISTTGDAVLIDGGDTNVTVDSNVVTNGGTAVTIQNRTTGLSTINSDITATGAGQQGVVVQDNTGGQVFFNGDMNLDTGVADGVSIHNNTATPVTINSSTIDLNASNGVGVDVSGTNQNVVIASNITNGSGTSVRVGGSPTSVTLNGDVTTGTGQALEVTGLGSGNVVVTGDLTKTLPGGNNGVSINNNTGGSVNISGDIDVDTGTADGVVVSTNSNGFTTTISGDVTTDTTSGTGLNINNNSGTTNTTLTGDINIDTTVGAGVSVGANSGSAQVNLVGSATNSLTVNTTSGVGVSLTGGGDINITGNSSNGNSITTSAGGVGVSAIDVSDATVLFTTIDVSGANAVDVSHSAATAMSTTFQGVTITSGNLGYNVAAGGSGEMDVIIDQSNVSGTTQQGVLFDTGAAAGRVDFTLTESTITTADTNAVAATIDDGTGDVRFLVQANTLTNTSDANATMDILLATNSLLSATVGVGGVPAAPIGQQPLSNSFTNNGAGAPANAFNIEVNDAAGTLNLDLRSNSAFGGAVEYELTNTAGTFNSVDHTNIAVNNPIGTINTTGAINDIGGPVAQPTP